MTSYLYALMRPLLFRLDPERAHALALSILNYLPKSCFPMPLEEKNSVYTLGLRFNHPIGLAAGFDKNGSYLDALSKLGFSFIEVGTVTPKPQIGNPKPRLFRIPEASALINRMGFNNHGVDALVSNIASTRYEGILGINIGKNKDTPLASAVDDYEHCLRKVYAFASYVTINISSPNTPDLRQLQGREYFSFLMTQLRKEQLRLADLHHRYVPLVIKLSPDESDESLKRMAHTIAYLDIDGIIATNTTADHYAVQGLHHGLEAGGISGRPLFQRSTECLRILKQEVGSDVSLIGVGGIDDQATCREKLAAGAQLVQVYTGFVYQGPGFVKTLLEAL